MKFPNSISFFSAKRSITSFIKTKSQGFVAPSTAKSTAKVPGLASSYSGYVAPSTAKSTAKVPGLASYSGAAVYPTRFSTILANPGVAARPPQWFSGFRLFSTGDNSNPFVCQECYKTNRGRDIKRYSFHTPGTLSSHFNDKHGDITKLKIWCPRCGHYFKSQQKKGDHICPGGDDSFKTQEKEPKSKKAVIQTKKKKVFIRRRTSNDKKKSSERR